MCAVPFSYALACGYTGRSPVPRLYPADGRPGGPTGGGVLGGAGGASRVG